MSDFVIIALSDERRAQMQKTAAELDKFWKDINLILESSQDKSLLQNIARLKYCIEKDPPLKSWFEIEARVIFNLLIYLFLPISI